MGALAPPAHPCGVLLVGVPRGGSRISQKGGGGGGRGADPGFFKRGMVLKRPQDGTSNTFGVVHYYWQYKICTTLPCENVEFFKLN